MNTQKIILLLAVVLVLSPNVSAGCTPLGNQCNYLNKNICDGDTAIQQGGECVLHNGVFFGCSSVIVRSQNCNTRDNSNQCMSGDIYTVDGYCSGGSCQTDSTLVHNCNDGISCTDDGCRTGSCTYTNNCDDGNPCTEDLCDGVNGCNYFNLPVGTDCGVCAECDGAGSCSQTPADDIDCGVIDCDGLDTACRWYDDLVDNRCEDHGDCKDANTLDCTEYIDELDTTDCGDCALCDGIGNCNVYDETQDNDCPCPNDGCADENNDGIIDAWNDYNQGECVGIFTCNSCGPTTTEPDERCKTAMKIPVEQYVSMFSLSLIPDTPVTFNDIQNGCTFRDNVTYGITYWDPLKEGEDKYVYIDANTLLYPGQGYFTSQENECEFTTEGYKFTSKLLGYLETSNIYNGWSMIGAPSDEINNFDLIGGSCNIISGPWGFDAADYHFERTQKLEPGKGYFTKTTNDCNLEFKGG